MHLNAKNIFVGWKIIETKRVKLHRLFVEEISYFSVIALSFNHFYHLRWKRYHFTITMCNLFMIQSIRFIAYFCLFIFFLLNYFLYVPYSIVIEIWINFFYHKDESRMTRRIPPLQFLLLLYHIFEEGPVRMDRNEYNEEVNGLGYEWNSRALSVSDESLK